MTHDPAAERPADPVAPHPSESIPAALALLQVDVDGQPRFRFVSKQLLEMLDLCREQVIADAREVLECVHPDDTAELLRRVKQVLAAPQAFSWDGRGLVRGQIRWWHLQARPRLLADGARLWEAALSDLTDTRAATRAQQASEARFERLVHFAPVPLGGLDRSGRTRFYNQRFTETYGYSAAELPDMQAWWQACYPDPEHRQWVLQTWDAALAAQAAGDSSRMPFKTKVTCKNGEQRTVEIHHTEIDDGCLGAFIDISDHQRTERRERELQAILREILNDTPLPVIAMRIVRAAEAAFPGCLCSLLRVDADQQRLRLLAAPSLPAFYNQAIDGLTIREGNGTCGTAAARRKRVMTRDLRVDPDWASYRVLAERAGLSACWSEPVLTEKDQEVLATFALYFRQPRIPKGQEIRQIGALASLLGLAIEHARVLEQLAQRTRCEEAVRDISRLFLAINTSDLDAAIHAALARIGACVGAHRCYLFQMDAGQLSMTCSHEWCAQGIRPQIDELRALPVDRYPWLPRIALSRQAAWVTQDDIAKLSPEELKIMQDGEIQSMLAMPLFETEQMHGLLGLDYVRTRKQWTDFQLRLLRLVADIISAALERDRLQRALQAQAYQDALTGLANRRAFDERLRAEMDRARRYRQVFALLLFDIDRFKHINDTHGHAVGDQILQTLAKVMLERLRQSDGLARWGGEEFALLLPETDASGALRLAEQLRQTIAEACFPVIERLTVSIGVTEFTQDDSSDSLFRRVDQALYLAKEQGRNCCRLSTLTL